MPAGNLIQSPYFATGDPETEEYTAIPVSGSTLPPLGSIGCVADFQRASNNWCRYQLVKVAAAITPVVGSVLYWSNKPIFEVSTARSGALAGICRIACAAAAEYIWILKKGRRTVKYISSTAATPTTGGLPVVGSDAQDGLADCLNADETQAAFPLIGTSAGTVTSQLGLVDVNIPDAY